MKRLMTTRKMKIHQLLLETNYWQKLKQTLAMMMTKTMRISVRFFVILSARAEKFDENRCLRRKKNYVSARSAEKILICAESYFLKWRKCVL